MFSNIFALAAVPTNKIEIVLGVALIVMALFLIVAVLLQSGKDKNLSGAISGSSETFFSKSKARTRDRILSKVTLVVSIIFAILVVAMYIFVTSQNH